MWITMVPDDNVVVIDGKAIFDLDFEGFPEDVHAVQWDDGKQRGELEFKPYDDDGNRKYNEKITSIEPFQFMIDRYNEEKARRDESSSR